MEQGSPQKSFITLPALLRAFPPALRLDKQEDGWEVRYTEQELFWLRYEWWEVEEVKCIYQLLIYCLDSETPDFSLETGLESLVVAEEKTTERGWPQLRRFFEGTEISVSGRRYLRRFRERAFHGFSIADPDYLNYFSLPRPQHEDHYVSKGIQPPETWRSLFPRTGKRQRWDPSPYTGVQLEHFLFPTPPHLLSPDCVPLETKRLKMKLFLRLLGRVFWDSAQLFAWVEYGKSLGQLPFLEADWRPKYQWVLAEDNAFDFDQCDEYGRKSNKLKLASKRILR